MRRFIGPVIAAAMLASVPFVLSDEATGVVRDVNPVEHTLTLENGIVFQLPADRIGSDVAPGQRVRVKYESRGGHNVASDIVLDI
ncbi:MAG: DUF1344 domain-containing protein [Alphaproteobacteria bacterium]